MLGPGGMNQRALLTLGLLLAGAARGGPRGAVDGLHARLREVQREDPMKAILGTVLSATTAFYLLERGHNPKVRSFYDALVYVSTNLSVGYSDIFAHTPAGKVLGSVLMAYGPALAASAFDRPTAAADGTASLAPSAALLAEISDKLSAIVNALEARPAGSG